MSIGEDIFDNDERVLINHLTNGENLKKYSKDNLLSILNFQNSILAEDSDEEIKELISGTLSKVNLMTEEEWTEIKKILPLPCLDEKIYEETEMI